MNQQEMCVSQNDDNLCEVISEDCNYPVGYGGPYCLLKDAPLHPEDCHCPLCEKKSPN